MSFPWSEYKSKTFGNSWFFANSNILIVNDLVKLEPINNLEEKEILEIGKIFLA